jgi:hypothetical protein
MKILLIFLFVACGKGGELPVEPSTEPSTVTAPDCVDTCLQENMARSVPADQVAADCELACSGESDLLGVQLGGQND